MSIDSTEIRPDQLHEPASDQLAADAWRLDAVKSWRQAVEAVGAGATPDSAVLDRLECGLADPRVRDAVLVSFVRGAGDLPERCVVGAVVEPGAERQIGRCVDAIANSSRGVCPPLPATQIHERTLEAVVSHGRVGHQAPASTLLALLAWWQADPTRAAAWLDRALGDLPGYPLGRLVRDLLAVTRTPGWVRSVS